MPMKSQQQRAYLWGTEAGGAEKFERETPKRAKLPVRAPKKKRPARKK